MKRICVFCGSNPGNDPVYIEEAIRLGRLLARRGLGLVYGGASVGIMGTLADAVLDAGGEVIGVIPSPLLAREVGHMGLTELRVVNSMHERKAVMAELSDGFIAIPGGLGTLDEFFEVLTWAVIGIHTKPCGLLNTNHYYDKLLEFLDFSAEKGFILPNHRALILVDGDPTTLLERLIHVG
jgi:uncharacterized protein (TIGR00730 family)